jgi:hypothetical protein
VLYRIAQEDKESFKVHEIATRDQQDMESDLDQLVKHQILDYTPQDRLYTVRLGLLVESLSHGILSVGD